MQKEKLNVKADLSQIGTILDFLEETLAKFRMDTRSARSAMLLCEESLVNLIESADPDSEIHIKVKKKGALAYISVSVPGPEIQPFSEGTLVLDTGDANQNSQGVIRDILIQAFEEKMRYVHKGKYSFLTIVVGSPEAYFAKKALLAVALAIVVGLILRFACPAAFCDGIDSILLVPIQEIYIDFVSPLVTPGIFLAIMASVSRYTSFYDPGRVTVKAFLTFISTSLLAIAAACGLFWIFQPGEWGQIAGTGLAEASAAATADIAGISVVDQIIKAILHQFQGLNSLRILLMAVVCGAAMGLCGKYSTYLKEIVNALQSLLFKAIDIVLEFLPEVAFVSTVSMMLHAESGIIVSVLQMIGVMLLGLLFMMVIYCLTVTIGARTNPIVFLMKYFKAQGNGFFTDSRFTIMNRTMRCCKNVFHISPKVYTFSIPFGSSFNMDGNCVYLMTAGLFILKVCGTSVSTVDIISLVITVFILSIAAPLAPASEFVCLIAILNQFQCPLSSVGILIGLCSIIGMLLGMFNNLGDVASTLSIAHSEGLIDTPSKESRS